MEAPSRSDRSTTHTIALVGLGLALVVAGLVLVSGSAQASHDAGDVQITRVINTSWEPHPTPGQLGSWWNVTNSSPDAEDIPLETIPQQGFYLVGVNYDAPSSVDVSQIEFTFVDDFTSSQSEQERISYTYRVNDQETGHIGGIGETGPDVHLANGSIPIADYWNSSATLADPTNSTGPNGCETSGPAPLGNPSNVCWFFIETDDQLSDGTSYGLQVTVRTSGDDARTPHNGRSSTVDGDHKGTVEAPAASVTNLDLTNTVPGTDQVTIETDTTSTLSMELSGDTDAEVDTWTCLYRSDIDTHPYIPDPNVFGSSFHPGQATNTSWHEGPDCEFPEFPTHDSGQEGPHAGAEGFAGEGTENPGQRSYDFSIDALEQQDSGERIDEFDFRILLRDSYGNIIIDQDRGDETGGNVGGPLKVAEYDISQELVTVPDDDVETFEDQNGCFQPESQGSSTAAASPEEDANTADNPCLRRLEITPGSDGSYPSIEIPVRVLNDGNAEDDAIVGVSRDSGATDWTLDLVGPSQTADELNITLGPSSPTDTPSETVDVRFSPADDAVAGETVTAEVTAESGRATLATQDPLYVLAEIAPRIRGSLLWEGGDAITQASSEPDRTVRINGTLENTGNDRTTYHFAVDDARSDNADGEELCVLQSELGQGEDPEDHIVVRFEIDGVTEQQQQLDPGASEDLQAVLEVGKNVPRSETQPHRCGFQLEDGGGSEITLTTPEPAIDVNVVGRSALRMLELTGARDTEEDITGETITRYVSPNQRAKTITLFMENVGNISARPQLSLQEVSNRFGLTGTWDGYVNGSATSRTQATQAFDLDVSDDDDPTRISDNFPVPGSPGNEYYWTEPEWACFEIDGDDDNEERRVCRLQFQFSVGAAEEPIAGDRVRYNFTWEAVNQDLASSLDVRLVFKHVGEVTVEDVSDRVVATDGSSTVTFDAGLGSEHRFDPSESNVQADLVLTEQSSGTECHRETVTSTSSDLRNATFTETISAGDCSAASAGDTIEASLDVTDENGTQLRMVRPAHVRVVSGSPSTPASEPSGFQIEPNLTMPANGSQYARVTFTTDDQSFLDSLQANEGIVLSRAENSNDIAPYTNCELDGAAVRTGGSQPLADDRSWTRIEPASTASSPNLNDEDAVPATEDVQGLVFQEGDDEAVPVGQISLFGWGGRPAGFTWNEGWNPVVLRLTDDSGNPAQPPTGSDAPEIDLTLKLAVRNGSDSNEGGPLTHSFELSSEEDAIPIEPLGQGYYRAHIYLPEQLADLSVYTEPGQRTASLADHPMDDSATVDYEAWALHAEVQSGQSVTGQDVSGSAYWRADQLGLLRDIDPHRFNGSVGANQIEDDGDTVTQLRTDDDRTQDPDESTRTFVHTSLRFLGGPIGPTEAWVTGPGPHNIGVFVLEESDEGQRSRETIDDNRTAKPYHEHTFQAVTDATGELTLTNLNRTGGIDDRFVRLDGSDDEGIYSNLVRVPDIGENFRWLGEISMRDGSGNAITPSSGLVFDFSVDPELGAATNGIPMPLCILPPAGDASDDAGDFDVDPQRNEVTLDLRSIPGLRPDRLEFAFTPVLQNDGGDGTRLLSQNGDLYSGSQFTIQAPGLVDLDDSLLPAETESGRALNVRVPATGPVGEITARIDSGEQTIVGPTTLSDPNGDGTWTGELPVSPEDEGNHTLVVEATDTSGGVTILEQGISIVPNTAPQITVLEPTGDEPSMPSNGSIVFAVDDATIASLSNSTLRDQITVSRRTGGGGQPDLNGSELTSENVNVSGIDSRVAADSTETITVEVTDDAGDPATGTVYVNLTSGPQFNASLTDGSAQGDVSFGSAGSTELTVEMAGSGAPNASFPIDVVDTSPGGSFEQAASSQVEYSFDSTTAEVTYTPDVGDASQVTARLVANLTGEPEVSRDVTVQIDSGAPTLSVEFGASSSGSNPTLVGPSTSLSATASDELTGVSQMRISADQNGTTPVTVSSGSIQTTIRELGISGGETVTLTITATDNAGNTATQTRSVQLDDEGPQISGLSAAPGDGRVRVTVQVTDNAGIESVQLYSQGPGQQIFQPKELTRQQGTYQTTVAQCGQGILEYYVQATDALGNSAQQNTRNAPATFQLSQVECPEPAPSVEILSPNPGARVSGSVAVELSIGHPDNAQVTVNAVEVSHSGGTFVPDTDLIGSTLEAPAQETLTLDTTQLANGQAELTVEVGTADATNSTSLSFTVDNAGQAQRCAQTVDLEEAESFTASGLGDGVLCVQSDPAEGATSVQIVVSQGGAEIVNETRSVASDGVYPLPSLGSGTYDVTLTQYEETEDGERREVSTSSASVTLSPPKPFGRFVAVLALGIVAVGAASYAAFGRWG